MGVTGLRGPIDSPRAASFRSFLVLNSLIVFITNSTLFSATPIATTASLSVQAWPDIILYGAIPSYVIAEWIFNPSGPESRDGFLSLASFIQRHG